MSHDSLVLSAERAGAVLAGAPWRRAAALGDSLVAGTGDRIAGMEHRAWVDRVFDAVRVHQPGLETRNSGVRDVFIDAIVAEQLPEILTFDPDLVIVNGGGNDMLRRRFDAEGVTRAYRHLVGRLADGRRTVAVFTMFEASRVIPYPEPFATRIAERYGTVQALVRDVAREHDCVLVDFGADDVPLSLDMWSRDGLHLNSRGHALAGAIAVRALADQTRDRRSTGAPPAGDGRRPQRLAVGNAQPPADHGAPTASPTRP
jgi:lysophospholipase L1-like esterase